MGEKISAKGSFGLFFLFREEKKRIPWHLDVSAVEEFEDRLSILAQESERLPPLPEEAIRLGKDLFSYSLLRDVRLGPAKRLRRKVGAEDREAREQRSNRHLHGERSHRSPSASFSSR
jgi:uncharacterized small protein (DUF1192 family)